MAASAILVVGTRSLLSPEGEESFSGDGAEPPASPIASLEILGKSIVEHTVARLHSAGIHAVSVVREVGFSLTAGRRFVPDVLMKQARKGFDRVLLIRLGAYAEVDCADLLRFHSEAGAGVTRVCDASGPLDFWVLDSAPSGRRRPNLDSASEVNPPSDYLTAGYVNRLADARDLRRLVADAFQGRCAIRPRGREVRPESGSMTAPGSIAPRALLLPPISDAAPGCGPRRWLPASAIWNAAAWWTTVPPLKTLPCCLIPTWAGDWTWPTPWLKAAGW